MRTYRTAFILGVWIAVLPYLGFPYSWKNILFTVSGLILVYYGYVWYREYKKELRGEKTTEKTTETLRESQDFAEHDPTNAQTF